MIPCCFHPTRVVVVDDNHEFLRSLRRSLSTSQASYEFFKTPQKALDYLNEVYQPDPFPNRFVSAFPTNVPECHSFDVDVVHTHHEAYHPNRFEEISVVIVDYAMPGKTGIDFCREIKDPNIQKILLTGVGDEHVAIQAFNEGIINHYIRKQDPAMPALINQAVENAQWRYFNQFSDMALKAIRAAQPHVRAIDDPDFHHFFKNLLKEHNFKEAYLCESTGSYVFLTEDGNTYALVVSHADQFKQYAEIGGFDSIVEPDIVQALQDQKKMLFYRNRDATDALEAEEWKNHLYPPQILQGKLGTYYYILEPDLFDIDKTRILPFAAYKEARVSEIKE